MVLLRPYSDDLLFKVVEGNNYTIVKKRYQIYWVSLTPWANERNRTFVSYLEGRSNDHYTTFAIASSHGFEPWTTWLTAKCSTTELRRHLRRGGRIWTYDLLVPNQARYRATLHPVLISHKPKNTTKIIKKHIKNKKPRTLMFRVSKSWLLLFHYLLSERLHRVPVPSFVGTKFALSSVFKFFIMFL